MGREADRVYDANSILFGSDRFVGQSIQGMGFKNEVCLIEDFGEKDMNSPWERERERESEEKSRFLFNLRAGYR